MEGTKTLSLTRQSMNNTLATRTLFYPGVNVTKEPQTITIKIKEDVNVYITFWADISADEIIKLTPTCLDILDAIYTISCIYDEFTIDTLMKVLCGNLNHQTTPNQADKIVNNLHLLSKINIKLDCHEEIAMRKYTFDSSVFVYCDKLVNLDCHPSKDNITKNNRYTIKWITGLYDYAHITGQMVSVAADVLDTHTHFNDTAKSISIKRYVIKRLAQNANSKNKIRTNRISYDWTEKGIPHGLFYNLGYTSLLAQENWHTKIKPSIHHTVSETLSHLKNHGYITSYESYRLHGSRNPNIPINGFEVTINKEKVKAFFDYPKKGDTVSDVIASKPP